MATVRALVPSRDEYEPAGSDQVSVAAAKVTRVGASGSCYAPRAWVDETVLVIASPDWWEIVENPEGITVEWEGGEKARDVVEEGGSENPQLYVGRAHAKHTAVLALLED